MRVAALYDIHANLSALEAVIPQIRQEGVDEILVGGDVFPGPMPVETIEYLLSLDIPLRFVQGNGDREVLTRMRGEASSNLPAQAREAIDWVAQTLPPKYQHLLATWPKTLTVPIENLGQVLFCHATPRNDTEMFTRLTPERRLLPLFETVSEPIVVCGHTHMQFDRIIGKTRVVNAGSVGMPFGEPGADWLLLGPGIQLRHSNYDLAKAAGRIRATKYPQAQDFAAGNILQRHRRMKC
jgi:predicted phosphodiesterase